jgi:hypothetical protein
MKMMDHHIDNAMDRSEQCISNRTSSSEDKEVNSEGVMHLLKHSSEEPKNREEDKESSRVSPQSFLLSNSSSISSSEQLSHSQIESSSEDLSCRRKRIHGEKLASSPFRMWKRSPAALSHPLVLSIILALGIFLPQPVISAVSVTYYLETRYSS